MMEIRHFTAEDIPFALEQTSREGWFTCAGAFESYLDHDPNGNFIGLMNGDRAGMITTTRYVTSAWVGNLIVPPKLRSRGVGRRLMQHALDHLQSAGVRTIRLDGDPPGLALYRSLGFVDECESLRFRFKCRDRSAISGVEPLAPAHMKHVLQFDASRFGDDRARLLEMLYQRGKGAFCRLARQRHIGLRVHRRDRPGPAHRSLRRHRYRDCETAIAGGHEPRGVADGHAGYSRGQPGRAKTARLSRFPPHAFLQTDGSRRTSGGGSSRMHLRHRRRCDRLGRNRPMA